MSTVSPPPDRRRRPRDYPLPDHGISGARLRRRVSANDLRHAVSNGFLRRVAHDLYVPHHGPASAEESAQQTLRALTADTSRVVGHETAAALWGFPGFGLDAPYHLVHPRRRSRTRHSGLVISHNADVAEEFISLSHGLQLTSPAWTWTDLALKRSLLDGLILADQALRPPRPEYESRTSALAHHAELALAVKARGRVNGVRRLRSIQQLARVGADSPMETALRFSMHQAGLPEPAVNEWLCDERGNRVVQPDLSIWDYRVAIQYEGWEFHSAAGQMLKDVRRQEDTEALGWLEVRITKEHMRSRAAAAVAKIARALRSQGWRCPSTFGHAL
ncbi:hypothetical protein [Garicola koreensis]|uniref:DUF559 domain-containing protein n=1 Tax=Garicola koreensis TaxID=1262554 RepID=A0A7W5TV89_9MICC|nr:hypothetical protein [Garicola koreensis]MBB3667479.1 hypothetical protein [Garicola koreensis]